MTKEEFSKMLAKPYVAIPLVTVAFGISVSIKILTSKTHEEMVKDAQEQYDKEKAEKIAEENEHTAEMQKLVDIAVDAFNVHSVEERKEALEELEKNYPELSDKWDEVRRNVYR
nr:MAG TPA: hypothetical protein [Caudoviricetes sp.]